MQQLIALGLPLGASAADAAGRVYFGLQPSSATAKVVTPVLKALRGRYQPDLDTDLTFLPGNSGAAALEAVRAAPADGSTALVSPSSLITLLPHLRTADAIDSLDELAPVASFGDFALAFVVGRAVPDRIQTMRDYVVWTKENGTPTNYGVPGLGTGAHFVGAELARKTGTAFYPTAYRGVFSMTEDLVAGDVPAAVTALANAVDGAQAGLLRILAVSSEQRWPGYPDLPTLLELDLADHPVLESYGMFMMKRNPAIKIRELGEAVDAVLQTAGIRAALANALFRPTATNHDTFAASLAEERANWKAWIKAANFSITS